LTVTRALSNADRRWAANWPTPAVQPSTWIGRTRPQAESQITELDSAKLSFDIGLQLFPDCGAGELKIIAAILEWRVIEKFLTHLGLDPQLPPKRRAREAGRDSASCAAAAAKRSAAPTRARRGRRRLDEWCQQ
jgi:hypothetical protein